MNLFQVLCIAGVLFFVISALYVNPVLVIVGLGAWVLILYFHWRDHEDPERKGYRD